MAAEPSDRKRAEFLSRAGQAFDRMSGADGQNGLVTFAQREERACEVADAAARWLMAESIALDPSGPSSVEAACPLCGGPMRRGFYQAKYRAVVGDGGNWIEPLGQMHFPEWEHILDFLHLLVHLYAAATAAYRGRAKRAWRLYEQLLRAAWAGRVQEVEAALTEQLQRLGSPSTAGPPGEPRQAVADTLAYVRRNRQRMDYPRYRRQGLPVTSAAVESLIKQMNHRVKGTEKFWGRGGAECVLAVRAAYLSEDGRAEAFHDHRPPGRAVGRARLRPAA